MKIKRLIVGLLILSSFSCYDALDDVIYEMNLNPASLGSLAVSAGEMSPAFNSENTSYNISVSSEQTSVTVTPAAIAPDAVMVYSIDGGAMTPYTPGTAIIVDGLLVGTPRVLVIEVSASGGDVRRVYTISITRRGSTDATLGSIALSTGTLNPEFSSGTMNYTVDVPYTVSSITVTGTVSDPEATLSSNNGQPVDLNVGGNTITLTVTAQDGITTRDYAVNVIRQGSGDATLGSLAVSEGTLTPAFSPETMSYTVDLPYSVSSITVTGTAADTNAALSTNNGQVQNLDAGANTVTVSVTAQDGISIRDYAVTVNRDRAQWARTLSGGTGANSFNAVSVDSDGNVYAAGSQYGTVTYNYGNGVTAKGASQYNNVVLVKYNSRGIALWAMTVSVGVGSSYFYSVSADSYGNVYAAGVQEGVETYTYGTGVSPAGPSSYNVVLVKYDSSGTALWARTISSGSEYSEFNSVTVDSAGYVYAAGSQYRNVNYTYGPGVTVVGTSTTYNVVLVKYDSQGTAQWARTVSSGTGHNKFRSVAADSDGNVYAAGNQNGIVTYTYASGVTVTGTSTGENVVLVKYNSAGESQWARTVSSGTGGSAYSTVSIDSEGNVYAAGGQNGTDAYTYGTGVTAAGSSTGSNVVLVKYNSAGEAQWARTVSSGLDSSRFYSVSADSAGNVYAAGSQYGSNGTYTYSTGVTATGIYSGANPVLVKYNSEGTAQWVRTISSGTHHSYFYSVSADSGGNVYTAGNQNGVDAFTYGRDVTVAGTSNDANAVLVKYAQ